MRITFIFIISFAYIHPIYAECDTDYDGPRRAIITYNDNPGIWFAEPIAKCLLRDARELVASRARIQLLEERLRLSDQALEDLRNVVEIGDEAIERSNEALNHAIQARQSAEDRLYVWWRSPAFWIFMGALITVGLVVVTAYALKSINETTVNLE